MHRFKVYLLGRLLNRAGCIRRLAQIFNRVSFYLWNRIPSHRIYNRLKFNQDIFVYVNIIIIRCYFNLDQSIPIQ